MPGSYYHGRFLVKKKTKTKRVAEELQRLVVCKKLCSKSAFLGELSAPRKGGRLFFWKIMGWWVSQKFEQTPRKLTWHWKIPMFQWEIHLQMVDFPLSYYQFWVGEGKLSNFQIARTWPIVCFIRKWMRPLNKKLFSHTGSPPKLSLLQRPQKNHAKRLKLFELFIMCCNYQK